MGASECKKILRKLARQGERQCAITIKKYGNEILFITHHTILMNKIPFAYFITFRTYGTWLHGDLRSSVSRQNNQFNTPTITPWEPLYDAMYAKLSESLFYDKKYYNLHDEKLYEAYFR